MEILLGLILSAKGIALALKLYKRVRGKWRREKARLEIAGERPRWWAVALHALKLSTSKKLTRA